METEQENQKKATIGIGHLMQSFAAERAELKRRFDEDLSRLLMREQILKKGSWGGELVNVQLSDGGLLQWKEYVLSKYPTYSDFYKYAQTIGVDVLKSIYKTKTLTETTSAEILRLTKGLYPLVEVVHD